MSSKFLIVFLFLGCVCCNPKSAEELYRLGNTKDSLGLHRKAFRLYTKAIRKNPKNADYYVDRATARYFGGIRNKHYLIMKDLNKAFELHNYYSRAEYARAYYYYNVYGDTKLALKDLDTLIGSNPKHVPALLLRAKVYMENKDTLLADRDYKRAFETSSNKTDILINKALNEGRNGFNKREVNSFLRALELNDKAFYCCYLGLANAYWRIGKKDSACYYWKLLENKGSLILTSDLKEIGKHCGSNK